MDSTTTSLPYQTTTTAPSFVSVTLTLIIYLVILVLLIVTMWRIYSKAGKPGWASIVPIYNYVVLLQIVERPWWWVLLIMFVPFVNVVMVAIVFMDLAKKFGKSAVYGFFMLFIFGIIGLPMLAFGKAQYQGAGAAPAGGPSDPAMPGGGSMPAPAAPVMPASPAPADPAAAASDASTPPPPPPPPAAGGTI